MPITTDLQDFVTPEQRKGFLKTDKSFPIGNSTKRYYWINCDICGHRNNIYEYVNGLWLCPKCATIIKNEEKRIIVSLRLITEGSAEND